MARNKKFEKLGVNEKFSEENLADNTVKTKKEKGKGFLSLLGIKAANKLQPKSLESFDNSDDGQADKYTYKKSKRETAYIPAEKAVVADAPKAPIVLFLCCLCLSLGGAFLLNADFVYGLGYGGQSAVKTAVSICVYVIPAAVYVLSSRKRSGFYNIKRCSPRYMPLILVILGLVLCASALQKYLIAYVFSYRVPMGVQQGNLLLAIAVDALVPALCEELLVRGVLQYEFSKYAGGFGGVLFSALLFTLLHFDLQFFFVYFAAGVILGTLTHVTKSVFPAMAVHFLNNAFSIFLSDRLTFVAIERIGGTLLIIVLAAACFMLLAAALQMMERISMRRAVHYLKKNDTEEKADGEKGMYSGKAEEDIILFTANGANTLRKTAKLFVNPIALAGYAVFLIVVIVALV